ncbi:hypothetical protein, partial [Enterococcus faecium]
IGNPSLNHRYRKGFYSLFKTLQQNQKYEGTKLLRISAPLKIRGAFRQINLKNIPLAIFTKGALTPTKFFLRKIDPLARKKEDRSLA